MHLDTKGEPRPLGEMPVLFIKNCVYIKKTVIEMESYPNGGQTIDHAAEEDAISNLKHYRRLRLPFALYWLALLPRVVLPLSAQM